MNRKLFAIAALSGFTSVALGAFAAHGLKGTLSHDMFEIWEVAVRYQFYHALAMMGAAIAEQWLGAGARRAGWLFCGGTILFSGSLYALSLTGLGWLGAITPFGGMLFLCGWAVLAIAAWRR